MSPLPASSSQSFLRYSPLSPPSVDGIQKFQQALIKHALDLPLLLFDIAFFVLGLSLTASQPWGAFVRRKILRPILQLLLHSFGITAGFTPIIWATEAGSFSKPTWVNYLETALFLEVFLFLFGFLLALGVPLLKHGMDELITRDDLNRLPPRIKSVAVWVPLPVGLIIMWFAYQDIVRLSLQSTGH